MAINELKGSPFHRDSKAHIFFEACDVDLTTGISRIVYIDELIELGLKTDNGGSWCRSDGPLGRYFNINRAKRGGRIDSVQLLGYAQNEFSNKIDPRIVKAYKSKHCCILAVGGKYIEIDHKDGRKNDFKLHDNQTLDDFQPMHKNANTAKRNHCKHCSNSGVRFNATELGYSCKQFIGTEDYHGTCIGCYWHDPKEFNAVVSERYVKDR